MKNRNNIPYVSPSFLASLPQSTPVLLAFSGGADSSALLHQLLKDARQNGFELHAAHFHHHIRGDEADRDAEFCKSVCTSLGIPFYLGEADVPSLAKKNGNSLETEAREQRYAFFEKIMRENNVPILVTAHHAEDQAESVLLHILRGSGIGGLRGIAPCRPFARDMYLVRPLLNAEKQDILRYCEENNIDFVTDSTNGDTAYARNLIRAEITPKLRELQPNLTGALARLSQSAADADDYIAQNAREFIKTKCNPAIPLESFNSLHKALRAKILALRFEDYTGGATLERVHVDAIIELCEKAEPHASLSLPCKISAAIENGSLIFKDGSAQLTFQELQSLPFREGKLEIGNGIVINIEKNPTDRAEKSPNTLEVKCSLLGKDAHFRSRREGDTVFTGKLNKKVKKLISERKIPLAMRSILPILVSNNEILWIPSVAVCDTVKADKIKEGEDFYRITVEFEHQLSQQT